MKVWLNFSQKHHFLSTPPPSCSWLALQEKFSLVPLVVVVISRSSWRRGRGGRGEGEGEGEGGEGEGEGEEGERFLAQFQENI
jgi:hypothetical protein